MTITWQRTAHYPGIGPDFYESEKVQYGYDYQQTYAEGSVQTRVNGPNTAYATVRYSIEWGSAIEDVWVICLNKHFLGSHAGQQARAWCRYLIANPVSSWQEFEEKKS